MLSCSDVIRYVRRVTGLYVYIMMFAYPFVDTFTPFDRVVCLHYISLSLWRHIYFV